MQIKVEELRKAMQLLAPVVDRKSTLPATEHIKLGNGLAMAASLKSFAACHVSVALPEAIEAMLVPLKPVLDLLERVPGHEMATLTCQEKPKPGIVLEAGGTSCHLDTPSPDDFPGTTQLENPVEGALDGDVLVEGLKAVAGYTASEDSRPVLTGVAIDLGAPGGVEVAAADGFRLSWRSLGLPFSVPEGFTSPVVLHRRNVELLVHLWAKADKEPEVSETGRSIVSLVSARRTIRLRCTEKHVAFEFGEVVMVSELIEGKFPDYRALVPQRPAARLTLMPARLLQVLGQVEQVSRRYSSIVRLSWLGEADGVKPVLTVQAGKVREIEAKAEVRVAVEGPAGHIGFDIRYLKQYLVDKDGLVTMGVQSPSAPALMQYRGVADVVLMPMLVESQPVADGTASQAPSARQPGAEAVAKTSAARQSHSAGGRQSGGKKSKVNPRRR